MPCEHEVIEVGSQRRRAIAHQPRAHPGGDRRVPRARSSSPAPRRADHRPVTGGGGAWRPRKLVLHALGQPREVALAQIRGEAAACRSSALPHHSSIASAISGAATAARFRPLSSISAAAPKSSSRNSDSPKREQKFQLIALVERAGAHGAQRFARGAEIGGIGPFAVALELRSRQHDGRRCRRSRGGCAPRVAATIGLVELPLVVGSARACEVPLRALRGGGRRPSAARSRARPASRTTSARGGEQTPACGHRSAVQCRFDA